MKPQDLAKPSNRFSAKDWLLLLLPFLLVGACFAYLTLGQVKPATVTEAEGQAQAPAQSHAQSPAELKAFTIEKFIVPEAGVIQIQAFNGSDEEVTIPQVVVDDAYWDFDAVPSTTVPVGGVVTFTLPYPWIAGELPEVFLLTSRGEIIESEVEPTIAGSGETTATASSQ